MVFTNTYSSTTKSPLLKRFCKKKQTKNLNEWPDLMFVSTSGSQPTSGTTELTRSSGVWWDWANLPSHLAAFSEAWKNLRLPQNTARQWLTEIRYQRCFLNKSSSSSRRLEPREGLGLGLGPRRSPNHKTRKLLLMIKSFERLPQQQILMFSFFRDIFYPF